MPYLVTWEISASTAGNLNEETYFNKQQLEIGSTFTVKQQAITDGAEGLVIGWGNTPLVVPVGSPLSLLNLGKNKINTKPYP